MDMECQFPKIFDKAKSIVKDDICIKFYDETKTLNVERDASGVGAYCKQEKV